MLYACSKLFPASDKRSSFKLRDPHLWPGNLGIGHRQTKQNAVACACAFVQFSLVSIGDVWAPPWSTDKMPRDRNNPGQNATQEMNGRTNATGDCTAFLQACAEYVLSTYETDLYKRKIPNCWENYCGFPLANDIDFDTEMVSSMLFSMCGILSGIRPPYRGTGLRLIRRDNRCGRHSDDQTLCRKHRQCTETLTHCKRQQ